MTQCGGPMSGGRRRSKKTRKGGGYGFDGAIAPGALTVNRNDTSVPYSSVSGQPIYDPFSTKIGGRRRSRHSRRSRHGRKGSKIIYEDVYRGGRKKRTARRRKMYGGVSQYLPAKSGAGFTGEGAARGMGGYVDVGGSGPMPNNVVPLA